MADDFNLQRFVEAQRDSFEQARRELAAGRKQSHWMWFIFPQIAGLGRSAMAEQYAISGLAEARAYLAHPVLGERLRQITAVVNAVKGRTAAQIFGYPDDLKFHSSMTLFRAADAAMDEFAAALELYFGGKGDSQTLDRIKG